MRTFFTLVVSILIISCGQKAKENKSYQAGFKTVHTVDRSRLYKPNTDSSDQLHYRPLDIDIWYPADSSASNSPILVNDLFQLLEQRSNYYSASNKANGLAAQISKMFCDIFKCSDSVALLNYKTNSFKNAVAAEGRFPLVIYMTAFDGMSYENFVLFETLAKKGFVVVSVNSYGRFPGEMTMKKEDLMEQVNDATATLNVLKENANIDFSKVGVVGYSWGGLSGAFLASRTNSVLCMVSIEGSEFHHYGYSKEDDADFDAIAATKDFQGIHLSIPYLRFESSPSAEPDVKDSVYEFSANHTSNAQIFKIDSMKHEDFDCLSLVVKKSGNCPVDQRYNAALKLTVSFLEDKLKNENNFSHSVEEEINKTIRKK